MQTFMPYPDFTESLKCLDMKRLGKQRVESFQILGTLEARKKGVISGWQNHPAVLMWEGYENALKLYLKISIDLWRKRGYHNNLVIPVVEIEKVQFPFWFGNKNFHASHRSNLLRKDKLFYKKYGWTEPDNLPYYWPVTKETREAFQEKYHGRKIL